jgi:hypothetical protein
MPGLYGVMSNYFWKGAATRIPENIKSVEFVPGARLRHEHKVRPTTNNYSLRKKNCPVKPEIFYLTVDCYHLNHAQTRNLSVLPGLDRADLYPSVHWIGARRGPRPVTQRIKYKSGNSFQDRSINLRKVPFNYIRLLITYAIIFTEQVLELGLTYVT